MSKRFVDTSKADFYQITIVKPFMISIFRKKLLLILSYVTLISCVDQFPQNNTLSSLFYLHNSKPVSTWSVTSNPSSNNEAPFNLAVDTTHVYVTGADRALGAGNAQIRIEKRSIEDGSLDTSFGTGGVILSNVSPTADVGTTIKIDDTYIYVGGFRNANPTQGWYLEKRFKTTGALETAFDLDGAVSFNNGNGADRINAIAISTTSIYMIGEFFFADLGTVIAKIDKTTGALDMTFSGAGSVTLDAAGITDRGNDILIDSSGIYAATIIAAAPDSYGRLDNGDLNGAADPTFNATGGVIINDNATVDFINTLAQDDAYIYTGGVDSTFGNADLQWQVNKYNKADGTIDTGFGASGSIKANPTPNIDAVSQLSAGVNNVYVSGPVGTINTWEIRAYNKLTGVLDPNFGISGILSIDPGGAGPHVFHKGMTIDANAMYLAGGDNSQGNMQWKIEKRRLSDGGL